MADIKVTLNRKLGPFKVWQWLLVIIVGIGLGLIIRRQFAGPEPDKSGTSQPSNPYGGSLDGLPNTQGAPTVLQQDFETVTAIREEQDRFRDETETRFGQFQDTLEEFFTSIDKRVDAVNVPVEPKAEPTPTPTKTVTPLPKIVDDTASERSYLPLSPSNIRALFKNYPRAFKGDPEYWVRGFLGTGTPGVNAAQASEWSNFWAAYDRAGLSR